MLVMSFGMYFAWMWVSQELFDELNGSVSLAFTSCKFYAVVFLSVLFSFLATFAFKSFAFNLWPTPSKYLRK